MSKKKGMAPCGVATAIVFATGIPVASVTAQEFAEAFTGDEPVGTPFEVQFDAALNDGAPASAVTSMTDPGSDIGGLGCVEEDGSISLHSSREARAAQGDGKCPEMVALDDFEDVDYLGVGITMCRLTEEYTVKEGKSLLGSIKAGIRAIFGGEAGAEGKVWRESTRTRCDYHGCDLDISVSEAVWSTRN